MSQSQQKQSDRVSFSFGMKLSLPAKYESADFHVSLSSDLKLGETLEQGFDRIKKEVEQYAYKAYQQIRDSEEGLTGEGERHPDPKAIITPELHGSSSASKSEGVVLQDSKIPKDTKVLKEKIKHALGVLEAQKKVTKSDFVKTILGNKKTVDMSDEETMSAFTKLINRFPELGL